MKNLIGLLILSMCMQNTSMHCAALEKKMAQPRPVRPGQTAAFLTQKFISAGRKPKIAKMLAEQKQRFNERRLIIAVAEGQV